MKFAIMFRTTITARVFQHMKPIQNQKQTVTCLAKRATLQATAITAALLALYLPMAKAEPAKEYNAQADIEFLGTSTLHDFSGKVAAEPFKLQVGTDTWSALAKVRPGAMSTNHKSRDRKMRKMFDASRHSLMTGTVYKAAKPKNGNGTAKLHLRICETEMEIPVAITRWSESADEIRFHATTRVSLKKIGLKPPSVLGLIRVGDIVTLKISVMAQAK
jgi:hypothetical protein